MTSNVGASGPVPGILRKERSPEAEDSLTPLSCIWHQYKLYSLSTTIINLRIKHCLKM